MNIHMTWTFNLMAGRICVDWMYLAQDRNQQKALVNIVMNLYIP